MITPLNNEYINSSFYDAISGRWSIPVMRFNLGYSPWYKESDPLNDDKKYQRSVSDSFYLRLVEKWLYEKSSFNKLLKYFVITADGNDGKVSLISDPDNINKSELNKKYKKYIFRYIEKYFISKKFIYKILKQFVNKYNLKWYDLFQNKEDVRDFIIKKLEKFIVSNIYESSTKSDEDEDKFRMSRNQNSHIKKIIHSDSSDNDNNYDNDDEIQYDTDGDQVINEYL